MKYQLPTIGELVHQDVFTRIRLPIIRIPEKKPRGRFCLWIKKEDLEFINQDAIARQMVRGVALHDDTSFPTRVKGHDYYSIYQLSSVKNISSLAQKTTHINLVTRERFPLRTQLRLIEHASKSRLHSPIWFTRGFLRELFPNQVSLSKGALPIEIPFCDISDEMKDVFLIPLKERAQKYGIVEFYNSEQTTNPDELRNFFTRGAMRSLVTRKMLSPMLQVKLYKAAKLNRFHSNHWLTTKQLSEQKNQGVELRQGEMPFKIAYKSASRKAFFLRIFNEDQLKIHSQSRLARKSSQSIQKNIFGGVYNVPAISHALRSFSNTRCFHCHYWADQQQIIMMKDILKLLPNEEGVLVKSQIPGGNRVYYNLQQMDKYDNIMDFIQKLSSNDIENILLQNDTGKKDTTDDDDWGFT